MCCARNATLKILTRLNLDVSHWIDPHMTSKLKKKKIIDMFFNWFSIKERMEKSYTILENKTKYTSFLLNIFFFLTRIKMITEVKNFPN